MIELTRGDLFQADAEALVNAVNCVGPHGLVGNWNGTQNASPHAPEGAEPLNALGWRDGCFKPSPVGENPAARMPIMHGTEPRSTAFVRPSLTVLLGDKNVRRHENSCCRLGVSALLSVVSGQSNPPNWEKTDG